jgi:hypothetical protein
MSIAKIPDELYSFDQRDLVKYPHAALDIGHVH